MTVACLKSVSGDEDVVEGKMMSQTKCCIYTSALSDYSVADFPTGILFPLLHLLAIMQLHISHL